MGVGVSQCRDPGINSDGRSVTPRREHRQPSAGEGDFRFFFLTSYFLFWFFFVVVVNELGESVTSPGLEVMAFCQHIFYVDSVC